MHRLKCFVKVYADAPSFPSPQAYFKLLRRRGIGLCNRPPIRSGVGFLRDGVHGLGLVLRYSKTELHCM